MTDFKNIKKVLVIKLRKIGDVLLIVPTIRAIREIFPDAYIATLVNKSTVEAITGNPLIDEIITFNGKIKKESVMGMYINELKLLWYIRMKGFDITIDLTNNDRTAMFSFLSGARYRLSYLSNKGLLGKKFLYTHLAKKNPKQHIILQNLDMLKQHGLYYSSTALSFYIPNEDRDFIRNIIETDKEIVHVHPVAGLFHKCWKDEYMAQLIDYIIDRGFRVVITSSNDKAEIKKVKNIMSLVKGEFIDLSGKTTLKQLGAISELSRFFIGVDSAPMHIAAAVGTPVIAFFGPSSETLWAPWCEKKLIISKDFPCRLPCKNKKGCHTYECITSITPKDVIYKVENFLRSLN